MEIVGSIGKRCVCAATVILCCMIIHISLFSFHEIPVTSPLQDCGSIYIAETMNVISRSAVTQRTTDYRSLPHLSYGNNITTILCAVLALNSWALPCSGRLPDALTGILPQSIPSSNIVSRK
ncbi:MAG: hypothetical protein IJM42_04920 [Synergistes sp.]|nr:hypothetical protein [Synergistes sp.]